MLTKLYNFLGNFFRKTRTINNEPLNKVSLIVLILIDIFIVINVFSGLADISHWHLSPSETYPCHREWTNYQNKNSADKDYRIISDIVSKRKNKLRTFEQDYQKKTDNRLGEVNDVCLSYARLKDKLRNPENKDITISIASNSKNIRKLERANRKIRSEYDSTLLEKIAGQATKDSINATPAEKAKQEITQNSQQIAEDKKAIADFKQELLGKTESQEFLAFLNNQEQYNLTKENFDKASFWYPNKQFGFQLLFLLPLIAIASIIHRYAQRQGYGLVSLISWHLLVIFWIPLVLKIFQFLQFGFVFAKLFKIFAAIFLNFLFLAYYLSILLVPLVGFGIIKLFQRIVFNPKIQAAKRVQKSRCVKCAKKIRPIDSHCPHCGEYQYTECSNCHEYTYKFLPHCNQCGHPQDL